MKTLLILSVIFCVALSIRAATVPAETAAVQQEDRSAAQPDVNIDIGLPDGRAAFQPQLRSFCLEGWESYRGYCYYLNNHPDTWTNAERYCADYGGSLTSVHSSWEYTKLQRLLNIADHASAWIGGYYFQGDWRWEDGSVYDYSRLNSASPTDHYQCLMLNSQGSEGWTNQGCSMRLPFICKVNPNC